MSAPTAARPVLEFRRVSFLDERRSALKDVDFTASPGECLVVFGRSGSGKRLLVRLAAGVVEPTSGEIVVNDPRPISALPVGYVPRDGGLLSNMTLLRNAMLPVLFHRLFERVEAERRARALFEELGASAAADRRPAMVSASNRRLAQLARALLSEPALFVLDDPLEDIDAAAARTVKRVLTQVIRARHAAVLLSVGGLGPYMDLGDRFIFVREGGITVFAGRDALLKSQDPEVQVFLP